MSLVLSRLNQVGEGAALVWSKKGGDKEGRGMQETTQGSSTSGQGMRWLPNQKRPFL